jgi:adenylate kinase family enzyme
MEAIQTARTVKVFILGRPGTGKSTAARRMAQLLRGHRWSTEHIDDYGILYWMYRNDRKGRFRPASTILDGFEIVDAAVRDEALAILRHRVDFALTKVLDRTKLVIIEFARSEYRAALEQFGEDFLKESYFLFLNSPLDECMKRIEHRAQHPIYEGDRFISRKTMESFYSSDDIPATRAMLKTRYGRDVRHTRVIYNLSSEEVFLSEVYLFVERVLRQEAASDVSC